LKKDLFQFEEKISLSSVKNSTKHKEMFGKEQLTDLRIIISVLEGTISLRNSAIFS